MSQIPDDPSFDKTIDKSKSEKAGDEGSHIQASHDTNEAGDTMDYRSAAVDDESIDESAADTAERETPRASSPAKIGRYEIRGELGAGAFGAVYDGYDARLRRRVAIKVPLFDASEEDAEGKFLEEARRLAQLKHTGIVTVYDVGVEDGHCYIVSDYITGGSLTDWLRTHRPTWQQTASIVALVADALAHAHAQGIVHRDIKTDNILLTESIDGLKPVLVDFGLAISDEQGNADLGYVSGTPTTMSPEQALGKGHRIDGRTDIYGLGVVMYEMLCGRLPFRANKLSELLRQVREDEPQPPRQFVPTIPQDLERICLKAMAKQINGRFTTAGDMAAEIRSVLGGVGESVREIRQSAAFSAATNDSIGQQTGIRVCLACGIQNYATAQYCTGCGASLEHQLSASTARQADSSTSTAPKHDSSKSATSSRQRAREAERRRITVLSCSCELVEAGGEADTEEQHEHLLSLQKEFGKVVQQFGGTVIQSTGQELVVCFGYPVAMEDAARRAASTGLRLMDVAAEQNLQNQGHSVSCWIGVHTGLAVVEDRADSDSVEPISIVGDVRTIANRLEEIGEGNTLIVSGETQELLKGYFQCEDLGSQKLRRVSRAVNAFRVIGKTQVKDRVDLVDPENLTPLIGRDMELGILKQRWEHAEEGMGQVVLLIGDAGLGKSRLIRELKEHLVGANPDSPIIEWRCSSYHENSALYPAIEFFERLLEFAREDSADARLDKIAQHLEAYDLGDDERIALLATLLSVPLDDRYPALTVSPQRRLEMTQSLLQDWFREYSSDEPVLFIVEDLHWMDPTSIEFLGEHVAQAASDNLMTLLTFRPEFETPWKSMAHQTQVALNRLTKRQIREMMLAHSKHDDIPQYIVDQVIERTDGVPLFVEEFTKVVEESGVLDAGEITESVSLAVIPSSLQDLLVARLERMASDVRVVQLAATIGREFTHELFRAVCDLDEQELQEELNKLVAAELLFRKGRPPKSRYIFKHALIQDAAYNSLLKKTRQAFHKRIAEGLEANFPAIVEAQPELLAHHFSEGDDIERGIPYWLKAGAAAQQKNANHEAISHFTAGLELIAKLPESPERDGMELGAQVPLGISMLHAKGYATPEVGPVFDRARELCEKVGDDATLFYILWGTWAWRLVRSDLHICRELACDMLELAAKQDDPSWTCEAHFVPEVSYFYGGDFETALRHGEQAVKLYDPPKCQMHAQGTGQDVRIGTLNFYGCALWYLGHVDQGLARAREAIQVGRDIKHAFSLAFAFHHSVWLMLHARLFEEALPLAEEARKQAEDQGFALWVGSSMAHIGVCRMHLQDPQAGLDLLRQGVHYFAGTGAGVVVPSYHAMLAEGHLMLGQYDQALKALDDSFQWAADYHDQNHHNAESHRVRGEVLLAASPHDTTSAEASFRKALEVAQSQNSKSWELRAAMSLARLLRDRGEAQPARELLASIFEWFTEGFGTPDLIDAKQLLNR